MRSQVTVEVHGVASQVTSSNIRRAMWCYFVQSDQALFLPMLVGDAVGNVPP